MALLSSGNNLMFIAAPIYESLGIRQSLHANYRLPKRNYEQGNALANETRK